MIKPLSPAFTHEVLFYAGHNVLCITDQYDERVPSITVTNAAEHVLRRIQATSQLPELIIYRDTDGRWDRILVDAERRFKGFSPILPGHGEDLRDRDAAIQLLITHHAAESHGVM